RQRRGERAHHLAASGAGGELAVTRTEARQVLLPAIRQLPRLRAPKLRRQRRLGRRVGVEAPLPLRLQRRPALDRRPEALERRLRDDEALVVRPAERALGGQHLLVAQRGAVRFEAASLVRAAVAERG